jgi:hypothetical protein
VPFFDIVYFFPIAQTLILEHLHKAVKPPIIIHQAVKVLVLHMVSLATEFDREPAASRATSSGSGQVGFSLA